MGYPDLQIKGRGRGGYPDPDVRQGGVGGGPRASDWSKNKGEARAPRAPPLDPSLNKIKYWR